MGHDLALQAQARPQLHPPWDQPTPTTQTAHPHTLQSPCRAPTGAAPQPMQPQARKAAVAAATAVMDAVAFASVPRRAAEAAAAATAAVMREGEGGRCVCCARVVASMGGCARVCCCAQVVASMDGYARVVAEAGGCVNGWLCMCG